MTVTMARIHLVVEVPADSASDDAACMRGLFAWVEELEDKAREQGEVVHLSIDGLPPRIVLVACDSELDAMRAKVAWPVKEDK